MNSSAVTTFTVFPGGGSLGRISTAWDGAGGIGGLFEQPFAPTALRAIYAHRPSDSTPARDHHSP